MRFLPVFALLMIAPTVVGHEVSPAASSVATAMRVSAERVLATLSPAARATLMRPFDDRDRVDWHYTPRSRNGVALKELDARGREAVHALLKAALSAVGYDKVTNIIELELVLREIETFGLMRDPERYHLTIHGTPSKSDAWGWRFEGHHLSLNFTLAGDHVAIDTPSFLGADPARVAKGPRAGLRVLAAEEDQARQLLESLSDAQRREAIFDTRTYGDIVTGNAETADPPALVGIAASRLSDAQRTQLFKLIEVYSGTFEPSLAQARMQRVRDGGIDNVRFGWAGTAERGRQHYYRVQSPLFLIEYDASQDGGNHIHTVWRDFNGDFGRDLLREHYKAAQGTAHQHSGR